MTCLKNYDASLEVCPDDSTLLRPIADSLQPGDEFAGRYEIVSHLGDGGWGKVYKARHKLMKRLVAIKMLLPHLVSSPAALKRFQHEAQAASALNHPNILTVYDFGISEQGLPYMVMDFLEGTSLSQLLQEKGFLSVERALPIFIQACIALSHAHSKGVIHRDIKPPNIMLVQYDGQPDFLKLVDFGIAKIVTPEHGDTEQLTSTGEIFGSPMYMSPEQCRGRDLDARSDIYSLGGVLFRTVTGKPAFIGRDPMECMFKQVHDDPPSFDSVCPELSLPAELEAIVRKAMEKEPDNRFADMNEFRDALDHLAQNLHIAAPRPATQTYAIPPGSPEEFSAALSTNKLKPHTTGENPKPQASDDTASKTSSGHTEKINTGDSTGVGTSNSGSKPQPEPAATSKEFGATPFGQAGHAGAKQSQSRFPFAISLGVALTLMVVFGVVITTMSKKRAALPPPVVTPVGNDTTLIDNAKKAVDSGNLRQAQADLEAALTEDSGKNATPQKLLAILPLLGDLYLNTEQFEKARDCFERIIPLQKREHGSASPDIARTQTNLAIALINLEEPESARPLLESSRRILEAAPPKSQSGLAETLYGLARVSISEGDNSNATALLNQAIELARIEYGPVSEEVSDFTDTLAEVYQIKGDLKKADQLFNKALKIATDKCGAQSVQAATVLKHLATLYYQRKDVAKSEATFKKAWDINNALLGPDSLASAEIQASLAVMYANEGRFADAAALMGKALDIRTKALGAQAPTVVRTRELLGKIQAAKKKSQR